MRISIGRFKAAPPGGELTRADPDSPFDAAHLHAAQVRAALRGKSRLPVSVDAPGHADLWLESPAVWCGKCLDRAPPPWLLHALPITLAGAGRARMPSRRTLQ